MTDRHARAALLAAACFVGALAALSGAAPPARARETGAPIGAAPPGHAVEAEAPSPAIFPPQSIPLRFNHRRHVRDLGLTCIFCHTAAATSRSSESSLLPSPDRCDACHGSDHGSPGSVTARSSEAMSQCAFCHEGYRPEDGSRVQRVVAPPPNLRFDHVVHLARGVACQRCHGAVESMRLATRDQMPRMRGCLDCHRDAHVSGGEGGACPTCHLVERGTRIRTHFATGTLSPPRWLHDAEHGPDWVERHKKIAALDSAFCASCHEESECTDCHDGRVRPRRIHPNDWLSLHPIAARQAAGDCGSCHREQSFCLSCHQRAGITLSGPHASFERRGRFHPEKSSWTDPPRSAGHHSWEAQRNMNTCVSCHTERDCAICHATAAMGGRGVRPADIGPGLSPHPAGFRNRCQTALRQNARPCFFCHGAGDPTLGACR